MAVFNPDVPVTVLEALHDIGLDPSRVIQLKIDDRLKPFWQGELTYRLSQEECQLLVQAYEKANKP